MVTTSVRNTKWLKNGKLQTDSIHMYWFLAQMNIRFCFCHSQGHSIHIETKERTIRRHWTWTEKGKLWHCLAPRGTTWLALYFPSSKPPYRFSKVVSFWTFLLIQLGLELGVLFYFISFIGHRNSRLQGDRPMGLLQTGKRWSRGWVGLVTVHSHLTPLPSSENDVRSVRWMENSASHYNILTGTFI
jgi:hypothetical protein